MQKSNRASIIVAVIAVILILGGIFILNQTFSSKNRSNRSEDDVATAVSSLSSSAVSSFSSMKDFEDDETETENSSLSVSSAAFSVNSSVSSTTSSSISDLKDGEAVVKVLSVNGNEYQIETIDSKGINSRFFAKGSKTRLQVNGVTLSEGKNYKVRLTVRDTENGFQLDLFQPLGEV